MADVRGEGIPEVVSHFRVAERLGAGGMGAVYKGYDRRDDSPVAIKFLHAHLADDPSFRERFEREAHVASLLTSRYTVHLLEVDETGGRFYIVMEYVEGHTLKDALKEGSLPLSRALRIALQVSRALEAAHAQNIVHRDIKPENVFLSSEDSVKVGDFGIARQEGGASLTVTGAFIGTLTYAAPEQMLGRSDHRSDIYALGATLYHMLAGRPPFSGTVQEMLRLVPEVPPPLEPLAGQPAAVVEIVVRCLAKDPDERYQTAAEFSAATERASRPGAAVVTEDETVVDRPAEETAAATLLEETAPVVPSGRPSVSMTLGPPRTASPMMARLASTRYDLTITNDGGAAAELELAATDEAGSCRFSLPRRVSVASGSATTLSIGVQPAKRRWRGGQQTHRFTVSASGAGDGPPISVSGDFTDLPYGWLPLGGVLSVGGGAAVISAFLVIVVFGGSAAAVTAEELRELAVTADDLGPAYRDFKVDDARTGYLDETPGVQIACASEGEDSGEAVDPESGYFLTLSAPTEGSGFISLPTAISTGVELYGHESDAARAVSELEQRLEAEIRFPGCSDHEVTAIGSLEHSAVGDSSVLLRLKVVDRPGLSSSTEDITLAVFSRGPIVGFAVYMGGPNSTITDTLATANVLDSRILELLEEATPFSSPTPTPTQTPEGRTPTPTPTQTPKGRTPTATPTQTPEGRTPTPTPTQTPEGQTPTATPTQTPTSPPQELRFVSIDAATSSNTATKLGLWDPQASYEPGETFSVDVTVDRIPAGLGVTGFQFRIRYDPNILEFTGVNNRMLLASGGLGDPFEQAVASEGAICVVFSDFGGVAESGPGVLSRIEFRAKAAGFSNLTFSPPGDACELQILDNQGTNIVTSSTEIRAASISVFSGF